MAQPVTRQRPFVWFSVVVFAHIVLISTQVNSRSGVPLLEGAVLRVLSQVQWGVDGVVESVGSLWTSYVDLRGVRTENERLRAELDARGVELQHERAAAARARQLQTLLDLRRRVELPTVAADVIGLGAALDFRTVTIDRGTADGVVGDLAVIEPEGVVGRVVTPTSGTAKVQLLIDRNAAAGVRLERTREQGIVFGTGDMALRIEYVPPRSDVRVGDVVVTSGTEGIYPMGLRVGTVSAVQRAGGEVQSATVQPGVDFANLESVLVVTAPHPAADSEGGE